MGDKVFMVAGGMSKFAKARPEVTFQPMVKEAYDYARKDVPKMKDKDVDGTVGAYFSDHFMRQLKAGAMIQDYLRFIPKSSKRIEGGGATGGLGFQAGWEGVASGRYDLCVVYGWETMSSVETWKGNEFIALASDISFDYPVGGFYSGYYAMMVARHMYEYGTTVEQLAKVSIKNHMNAMYNPYAQQAARLTVDDVRKSPMVAWPLTRLDICAMSDGAAVAILCDEDTAWKLTDRPVEVTGVGCGTDAMRMADRPQGDVILLPHEKASDYVGKRFKGGKLAYPGIHSFRAGRQASKEAYEMAKISDPKNDISFIELHDAYTSSEIQTYEDMGLCKYGDGGKFVESGAPFLKGVDYGLTFTDEPGQIPVNPSGGLLACGHPVGATGLMQAVFAFWQLQGRIKQHLGNRKLQVPGAERGLIHSHAGTGTYVTVSVLERRH